MNVTLSAAARRAEPALSKTTAHREQRLGQAWLTE
jgi:hypothetical protein